MGKGCSILTIFQNLFKTHFKVPFTRTTGNWLNYNVRSLDGFGYQWDIPELKLKDVILTILLRSGVLLPQLMESKRNHFIFLFTNKEI